MKMVVEQGGSGGRAKMLENEIRVIYVKTKGGGGGLEEE
jgi:hypothetical protein